MPKFHPYPDHQFVVLHAPERGEHGHVHYVELDQFIGPSYLVTVHGPTNPAVPAHVPLRDTSLVWDRIREGRLLPGTPTELSHAIVASMVRGMEEILEVVTEDVWGLEQEVTLGAMGDPEAFLDGMFRTRHALLAVSNITATSLEVYDRMVLVAHGITEDDRNLLADNIDQFRRAHRLADVQREYLQGVIEFYRTRTDTKMTIAAERLAVIAVVTLPITALASVLGMNVIVNTRDPADPPGHRARSHDQHVRVPAALGPPPRLVVTHGVGPAGATALALGPRPPGLVAQDPGRVTRVSRRPRPASAGAGAPSGA